MERPVISVTIPTIVLERRDDLLLRAMRLADVDPVANAQAILALVDLCREIRIGSPVLAERTGKPTAAKPKPASGGNNGRDKAAGYDND